MADSIQEQIVKKIATALSQITVANGFDNTIAYVQRHQQSGIELDPVPTILIREGECAAELDRSAALHIRRRMELFAVVVTRQDEVNDPRSGGEILNSLVADIEKQLATNQKWDGLAIMTDPPSYLEVDVEAMTPHLSRGMRFETTFEHLRTNPYAQ